VSQFEYLAVFISVVFGISLTHMIAGVARSIYSRETNETRLVFTVFAFYAMVTNWWTAYSWQDQQVWTLDQFLVIIIWSFAHYLTAITLYPPQRAGTDRQFEYRQDWYLWAMIGVVLADVWQTAMRGDVFSPWYYLPYALHYPALGLLAIFVNRPKLHRWIAWYFLGSAVVWSMVVRRILMT
jgi:hypothetical protein